MDFSDDLRRYYVPFTRTGSLAVRLGLHRELEDHFPELVLAKAREVRSAWYNRKFQSSMES